MAAASLNTALNKYYESKIKINTKEKSEALNVWQRDVERILNEVKRLDDRFAVRIHYTGSFYERAKTASPDEFDLMLELTKITPQLSRRVTVHGFTSVTISDPLSLVHWRRDGIADEGGKVDAVTIRAVFARHVNEAITNLNKSGNIKVKTHGPAVTLNITVNSSKYDVDLTLAIKLPSWPTTTNSWKCRARHGWPSDDLIRDIDKLGCHVVAKQPGSYSGQDKRYLWRYSLSLAEKAVMTNMDSGISNSCRKRVLQLLKAISSNDPQLKSAPLTSYHMKTVIFWESEKYPNATDWTGDKIGERFLSAVGRLLGSVKKRSLPHYFLNNVNLMADFNEAHFSSIVTKFNYIKEHPVEYLASN